MRLGNGMEVEPWLKAAVRKEFVDDNRVKVNSDGDFVDDFWQHGISRQVLKPHSAVR
ncbi:autotransporter outer membrane beta-barrel domain-containing protein [Escherichia coli]